MSENLDKSLGGIYDRLTKIETILEHRDRAERESSIGPRLQSLEIKYATMQGRMMGLGAAAGIIASLFMKFV